jgi:hypothetical protein
MTSRRGTTSALHRSDIRTSYAPWLSRLDPLGREHGELPGVDPRRLAIWGFSVSGGHVVRVAASDPGLAGAAFGVFLKRTSLRLWTGKRCAD